MALKVFGQVKGSALGRQGMMEEVYWYEEGLQALPQFIVISYVQASGRELNIICDVLDGIPKPAPACRADFPLFTWRSHESCFAIVDAIRTLYPPPDPESTETIEEDFVVDDEDDDPADDLPPLPEVDGGESGGGGAG